MERFDMIFGQVNIIEILILRLRFLVLSSSIVFRTKVLKACIVGKTNVNGFNQNGISSACLRRGSTGSRLMRAEIGKHCLSFESLAFDFTSLEPVSLEASVSANTGYVL